MAKNLPNATQLTAALQAIGLPGGRQLQFLKAHYQAPGKALTAARLAKAAKYQSWRGSISNTDDWRGRSHVC